MKAKLFTYAVIWHPNEKQIKDGEKSRLVIEPTNILVKDLPSAQMTAAMAIPTEYKDQLDQLDIAIRDF